MVEKLTGKIFDIQGFTVNDGPGIRTEIFFKGCPLKCLWCHSPESQAPFSQVAWYEIRCIGIQNCGKCLEACGRGALKRGRIIDSKLQKAEIQVVELDRKTCDNCGKCTLVCPANALAMTGVDITIEEVMARIQKDEVFYRKSGGGVTLSGGEPMLQHRFVTALIKECKNKGLHTCLSTSGYTKWEHLQAMIPYLDLALYDIKHMDPEKSREYTGVSNELILENAKKLASAGVSLYLRIPVIPGYNSDEDNLRATCIFSRELGPAVKLVQILPYHRLGLAKYERLQQEYGLNGVEPPGDAFMESCKKLIESYGFKVQIH